MRLVPRRCPARTIELLQPTARRSKGFSAYCLLIETVLMIGFIQNRGWAPHPVIIRPTTVPRAFAPRMDPQIDRPAPPLRVIDRSFRLVDLTSVRPATQIVVFSSPCLECALPDLFLMSAAAQLTPHIPVRVIFAEPPSAVQDFLHKYSLSLDAYSEYDGQIPEVFNVAWRPRVYAVDSEGILRFHQPPMQELASALERGRATVRRR